MSEKTSWEPNQNSRFSVGDLWGPPIVLSLYKRTTCNEISKISKMPKVKKHRKSNRQNGKRGGRPKAERIPESSDDDDSDPDYFIGPQPRVDNSSSSFIMTLLMLQMVVDAASSCACGSPKYKTHILSYKGFNCHLLLYCKCGNKKTIWAAPEHNFDEACLLSCKLSGIQQGQIQDFLTCMNFGFENENGKTFTINVFGQRLTRLSKDLDIKLDGMNNHDQQIIFNRILASTDTEEVEISTDGMYPIRNNSGICVSSVMGTIDGEKKIIGT